MQRPQYQPLDAGHVVQAKGQGGGCGFLQSLGRIVEVQPGKAS
jgi:hypothetical protein